MGSIILWIPFFVKFLKSLVFNSPRIKEFIFKFSSEIFFLISNSVAELFILVWILVIWGPSYDGPCPSYDGPPCPSYNGPSPSYDGPPVHHIMDPIQHMMDGIHYMMLNILITEVYKINNNFSIWQKKSIKY